MREETAMGTHRIDSRGAVYRSKWLRRRQRAGTAILLLFILVCGAVVIALGLLAENGVINWAGAIPPSAVVYATMLPLWIIGSFRSTLRR